MGNPWELIDLAIYEKHLSSNEVYQLQTLNQITKEQLADNDCTYVGILGIAGGNGLDHINLSKTKKVYAIDINKTYLEICRKRFDHLSNTLELLHCDLTANDVKLPYTSLLICNLIIEYLGENEFVSNIARNKSNLDIISCVIQKNNNNSFVSPSAHTSHFDPIASIHHDIDERSLKTIFYDYGFVCIKCKNYDLPNGKEFIRMDFK